MVFSCTVYYISLLSSEKPGNWRFSANKRDVLNVRFWPLADSHSEIKNTLLVYIQTQFITIESGQGISPYIYPLANNEPLPRFGGVFIWDGLNS